MLNSCVGFVCFVCLSVWVLDFSNTERLFFIVSCHVRGRSIQISDFLPVIPIYYGIVRLEMGEWGLNILEELTIFRSGSLDLYFKNFTFW